MKTLKALSDRVLKMFLSDVTAGACVPEYFCCCGTTTAKKAVNCYGSCVTASSCSTSACNY